MLRPVLESVNVYDHSNDRFEHNISGTIGAKHILGNFFVQNFVKLKTLENG